MSKVEITINGNKIMAEKGNNLLETALQNGIDIPHLCYDPRIKPFGSCRLCFIETGGPRGPVAACGTVVAEGMAVVTDNESLYKLRKTALELLLSEHCGDCIAPCQEACPAHIDIQGYIALLDRKEYKKAAELIKEKMPLPSICGRVCPRFCEDQCRRNMVDDPVNICDLKRFAGDYDLEMIDSYKTKAIADSGKTVAVVGGGPAGLTVAYYLALKGHRVTLFDRGPKLGGMLRYGIPEYRLPKALLDREINLIAGLCREVRLGEVLGKDFTIEDLTDQYDAVFLGLGCQSAQGMGLEGEDRPGILKGIDLLRSVAEGTPPVLGKKVAVIGGGNTAMDAARTALRLGSEEVHLIYRRSRNEMPAALIEIEEAEEEGIKFDYLTNPVSVLGTDCVKGVGCVQMKLGEPDESGRCRPLVVEGSEFMLEVDNVIMAIGQTLDQESTCACSIELKGKTMAACSDTGQTSIDKVFAAGDAVTGPATVVEAVGAARNVALAINRYLQGLTVESESESYNCSMGRLDLLDPEDFSEYPKEVRLPVHHLAPEERKKSFVEYNQGLSEEDVVKETKRCLSCGCQNVFDCSLRQLATDFKLDNERLGTEKKRYPIRNDHLFIVQDPNKCVLCANCVRICHEVQGANALCLVNRGYDTIISPTLQLPLNETTCESCGQCISVCPTGALTAKGYFFKPGPWFPDRVVESTCTRCGIGCRVELSVVANRVIEINSPLRQDLNDGNLCIRGRYEPLFAQDTDRILKPFINFDGQKKLEINWPEALERAATGLVRVKKESGPGSIAVIITSSLSNEEMILTQQLAVDVLGSDRIYSTGLTPATASIIGKPLFYKEIAESDFILVVDADLPEDYPIVAQKIRKALAQEAKLVFIGTAANRLVKDADVSVLCNPGKLKSILNTLLYYQSGKEKHLSLSDSELTEALASLPQDLSDNPSVLVQIAELFLKSSKPVVIINGDTTDRETYDLLAELYRQAGNDLNPSILALYRGGNTAGLIEMGFAKGLVDGKALSLGCNSDQVVTELLKQMKGLLLIGDDPAALIDLAAPDSFIVAMAAYNQSKLQKADLVLPLAGYFETTGTVVNSERRLCELRLAYAPLAGKSNSALLIDLAKALGANLEPITKNQVVERISQLLSLED